MLTQDFSKDLKDNCDLIPAKMVNQSEDGLFIEIDRCLQPGSNVMIKIAFPGNSSSEDVYYIRDGLVRWCEKVAASTSRFEVGIKILRNVVRAPVLTSRLGEPAS
jgi:Tfp pilus assembly protein PilZ